MRLTERTMDCLAAALAVALLAGCDGQERPGYQGYVEGNYLYLAAPQAGYLKTLDVPRGARVTVGETLFTIDSDPDDQVLAQATAQAGSVKEKLANLQEPRRPPEIATMEANLRAAQASLGLAKIQLRRQQELAAKKFVSAVTVDEARSTYAQAAAQVESIKAQIASYRLTIGRKAEVRGAAADLEAANALVAQKRWVLERKAATAPEEGEVAETYYQPGEWVPAGAPVISLLPDTQRKIRFFVPETVLAQVKTGGEIEATCDACKAPIRAKIDFIAPQAEYTPPVIYSRGSREKLVFRVEAQTTPEQARLLRPGLPVDVRFVQ